MTIVQTIGKDNKTYQFKYIAEGFVCDTCKIQKISFMVYFADDSYDDFFDFKLAQLDVSIIKITDMFLDTQYRFQGKGLPEAMILEAQKLFPDKQIISSTNNHAFKKVCNEWRTIAGSHVWDRLLRKGLATYNKEEDVYYLKRRT